MNSIVTLPVSRRQQKLNNLKWIFLATLFTAIVTTAAFGWVIWFVVENKPLSPEMSWITTLSAMVTTLVAIFSTFFCIKSWRTAREMMPE